MMEHEILLAALSHEFGLIVKGSAKSLRAARSALVRDDIALDDLAILGPDEHGYVWLIRKSAIRNSDSAALARSEKNGRG